MAFDLTTAQQEAILRARALLLAAPDGSAGVREKTFDALLFRLGGGDYAVRSTFVSEVLAPKEITPLPGTPAFVMGIINVRGQIFSVNDLLRFLGLGFTKGENGKVVIMRSAEMELGIMVDEIIGVRSLAVAEIQPGAGTFRNEHNSSFEGVTAGGITLLNAANLLADEKLIVNDDVEA